MNSTPATSPETKIKLLRPNAVPPERATGGAAGYDLRSYEGAVIAPGESVTVQCGFSIAVPENFAAFIYPRSGLSVKRGIALANCIGVVDSDYRGEVCVPLRNYSQTPFTVSPGDRIAQMIIAPVFTPVLVVSDELPETRRGAGGFGSTGVL